MEWGEMMRKRVLIELVLTLIILGVSFWNIRQQQESVFFEETIANLKEKQKVSKRSTDRLISENERLSYEVSESSKILKKTRQIYNNSGTNLDLNSEFVNVVTKLFAANLNFTPENYVDRKNEVSGFLSEELSKEYFGENRKTYQDANDTTSKLVSLDIYTKGLQQDDLEGLVVIYYKSKHSDQDWIRGMNIFKITYNSKSEKVTNIINLGSEYSNDK
ncbi:hypothetical protein [Enterococcus hulanensis]|uniref:hypothetical protein n=1 Tax=Enterococcus hulanensis TaxID=2559929 RepID=UPI001F5C4033|nr:hypothetical protein [Enterococcus hulanensis]